MTSEVRLPTWIVDAGSLQIVKKGNRIIKEKINENKLGTQFLLNIMKRNDYISLNQHVINSNIRDMV